MVSFDALVVFVVLVSITLIFLVGSVFGTSKPKTGNPPELELELVVVVVVEVVLTSPVTSVDVASVPGAVSDGPSLS